MKTSLEAQTPEFKPFTIKITFDSLHEAKLIEEVLKANLRIPEMLLDDNSIKNYSDKTDLTILMREMYKPLYKAIYNKDYK